MVKFTYLVDFVLFHILHLASFSLWNGELVSNLLPDNVQWFFDKIIWHWWCCQCHGS